MVEMPKGQLFKIKMLKLVCVTIIIMVFICGCQDNHSMEIGKKVEQSENSDQTQGFQPEGQNVETRKANADEDQTNTENSPKTEEEISDKPNMALLEIKTISDNEDVMRFVTEPVTGFVSDSIKTWNPDYSVTTEPYYEDCYIKLTDTNGNVAVDGAEAEVKVRGNWTTCYPKKPLRIKFKKKHALLGLNGGNEMKNWILLAEYKDASMLRNKAAFYIGRELLGGDGLYCADSKFVELVINGQYWGVYLLTEKQEADTERINITVPEKDYSGTDIGYLLELDGYYVYEDLRNRIQLNYANNAPLIPFDGNGGGNVKVTPLRKADESKRKDVGISIKSDIYSDEQREFIRKYLDNVYYIMYSAAYNKRAHRLTDDMTQVVRAPELGLREAVERVVDLNSLADMYILSELTCDQDLYWSSFFMDVDFGEYGDRRLRFEAPWDYDSAMGNTCDPDGLYAANMIYDDNNRFNAVNPWLCVLMNADWFRDIVRDKWGRVYAGGVIERTVEMITADSDKYFAEFGRNYEKWNNILDERIINELSERAKECKTQREAADYLKEWIAERAELMNGFWGEQ